MKKLFIPLITSILIVSSSSAEPVRLSGIVNLHNQVRAQHNLQPLTWSNSLAQYAQEWVDHLAKTQRCEMIHRPNYGGGRFQQINGENLFWASAIEITGGEKQLQRFSVKNIIDAWAEEEQFYDYQSNQCQAGQDCGHYTQMVWEESRQVGCAIAVCADKSQIWACNYYPRGNYIGERPY